MTAIPHKINEQKPRRRKQQPKRPPRHPRVHAIESSHFGREIAAALGDSIRTQMPPDAELLTIYQERLHQCSRDENIWYGKDLHNADGEPFDGAGRFWTCGQKLCPYCIAKQAQRNRKRLRAILRNQTIDPRNPNSKKGLLVGHHLKFLTLTMVKQNGMSLRQTRQLMQDAWALFRKRRYFERVMIGGCKSEEFTLNRDGYHYHLHILGRTRYIDWSTFRSQWTECVEFVFREANIPFKVSTSDGWLWIQDTPLRSVESGIQEVAKYITKSDSWSKLRDEDLLDVVRIERWPRMFEFFGTFRPERKPRTPPVAALGGETTPANKTIVHTTLITDLDSVQTWRNRARRLGLSKYLAKLQRQITTMRSVRIFELRAKYQAAELFRFPGEPSIDIREISKRVAEIYRRSGHPPPKPKQFSHLSAELTTFNPDFQPATV